MVRSGITDPDQVMTRFGPQYITVQYITKHPPASFAITISSAKAVAMTAEAATLVKYEVPFSTSADLPDHRRGLEGRFHHFVSSIFLDSTNCPAVMRKIYIPLARFVPSNFTS